MFGNPEKVSYPMYMVSLHLSIPISLVDFHDAHRAQYVSLVYNVDAKLKLRTWKIANKQNTARNRAMLYIVPANKFMRIHMY